jgi:hypothetical protein
VESRLWIGVEHFGADSHHALAAGNSFKAGADGDRASWRRNSGRDKRRRVRNIATMPRALLQR